MNKLTLNADPEVIADAKRIAGETGTSVSSLFERFIRLLARRRPQRAKIGPLTRRATGVVKLPRGKSDRDIVAEALADKYGFKR